MGAFDCCDMDSDHRVRWHGPHFDAVLAGVLDGAQDGIQRGPQ